MGSLRWGFTGRTSELAIATEVLLGASDLASTSVLIVGRRGTGKSRFAEEVVRRTNGAVDAVLDLDGRGSMNGGEAVNGDALEELTTLIATGKRVVVTASSSSSLPESIAASIESGHLRVVTLRELTRSDSADLVSAALGGPVSGRLVSALWRLSHGSLSVLTAAVEGSLAAGQIYTSSGVWDCAGEIDLSIVEAELSSRVRLLTDEHREVLYTVALSDPIPSALLEKLAPECAIDALCSEGLMEIATLPGQGPALFAAVTPPAHGVVLRASVPASRRRRIVRRLLDLEADGSQELVRPVAWAVDNGETVSPDRAVRAADRANRLHDYRSTVRIASALIVRGATADVIEQALLHRSIALRHLTRFDDALADLERLRDLLLQDYTSPASETWCERWVSMVAAYADTTHGADLDCTSALAVVDECTLVLSEDDGAPGRNARRHLAALRVQHQAYAGRFIEALAEYDALGRLPSPLRQRLDVITTAALVCTGAARQASTRLADAFRQAATVVDAPWLTEELFGARFLTTLRTEGPAAAMALAAAQGDTDRVAIVRWDDGIRVLAEAELRVTAGDVTGARYSANEAVSIIEEDGPRDYLARALSLAAESAALSGEHDSAARLAARTRSTPGVTNSVLAADIAVSLATVDVLRPAADVCRARDVAATFAQQRLFGVAARILHVGVRLGDGDAAADLLTLADVLDGELNSLFLEHARAVASRDAGALLGVSTQFLHRGLVLVAAETAQAAGLLSLAQSQHDLARAAERQSVMLHGVLDFENVVTLRKPASTAADATLTRREQEIASLVASGMSNRDMASTLGVSVRTIEGHLGRMYAKMGISGRRGLLGTRSDHAGS